MSGVSLLNGEVVRLPHDEDRPAAHGRLHEPDPSAVERLKAFWAEAQVKAEMDAEAKAAEAERVRIAKGVRGRAKVKAAEAARVVSSSNGSPGRPFLFDDDEIRAFYGRCVAGERVADLATELEVEQSMLYRRFRELGLSLPVRARRGGGGSMPKLADGVVREVYGRYLAGEKVSVLAVEFGVSTATLYNRFDALGLERVGQARGDGGVTAVSQPEVDRPEVGQPEVDRPEVEELRVRDVDVNELMVVLAGLVGSGRGSGRLRVRFDVEVTL